MVLFVRDQASGAADVAGCIGRGEDRLARTHLEVLDMTATNEVDEPHARSTGLADLDRLIVGQHVAPEAEGRRSGAGVGGGNAEEAVVIIVVVNASRGRRQNTSVRSAILSAQYDQEARSRRGVSLDALRERDPNLTEQSIVDRVRRMSDVLREAWMYGNMAPARPFVSDGVYSRFQVQLALMRQEGVRNVMSDAAVLYVTMEAVQSSPPLDAVHVRFTAQARDANVPLNATPQQIQAALAQAQVAPYTEIWTLVRRQGAQTKLDASQVGKACPSCSAPFDVGGGEILTCKYCKALVCSGEHDWVLAEITQLEEWHPTSADPVFGLDQLRQVDLGAAREVLEDRASYLFWKWGESGRFASPAPLKKAATPALLGRGGDGPQLVAKAKDIAVGGGCIHRIPPCFCHEEERREVDIAEHGDVEEAPHRASYHFGIMHIHAVESED